MKVPSISAKPDTLRKFNSELSHAIVKAHVNKNKNELKKLDVMERCIIAISKYRNIYKNVKNIRMCSTKGQEESKDDEEEMEETEKAEEKAEMVEMEEREETEETENEILNYGKQKSVQICAIGFANRKNVQICICAMRCKVLFYVYFYRHALRTRA